MSDNSLFINGRQQIIDMLKILPPEERQKLINKLRIKSPHLAEVLESSSKTFEDIFSFSDESIRNYFNFVDPKIVGLAIKGLDSSLQRRVLRLINRDKAEIAFEFLHKAFNDQPTLVSKARNKILSLISSSH